MVSYLSVSKVNISIHAVCLTSHSRINTKTLLRSLLVHYICYYLTKQSKSHMVNTQTVTLTTKAQITMKESKWLLTHRLKTSTGPLNWEYLMWGIIADEESKRELEKKMRVNKTKPFYSLKGAYRYQKAKLEIKWWVERDVAIKINF